MTVALIPMRGPMTIWVVVAQAQKADASALLMAPLHSSTRAASGSQVASRSRFSFACNQGAPSLHRLDVELRPNLSVAVFGTNGTGVPGSYWDESFGVIIWPSSWAVADTLCSISARRGSAQLRGLTVLELGAGTGFASLTAMWLGARVIATDVQQVALNDALPSAAAAATAAGAPGTLEICQLDVLYDALPSCSLLLAADLLYVPGIADTLGAKLRHLCPENEARCAVVIADPGRLILDGSGRLGQTALIEAWGRNDEALGFVDTWLPVCSAKYWRLGADDLKVGLLEVGVEALCTQHT